MKMNTPADLAEIMQIDVREIETLRRRHRWPHVKAGRKNVRFTDAQVDAIIAMHTVETPAADSQPAAFIDGQTSRSKKRAS